MTDPKDRQRQGIALLRAAQEQKGRVDLAMPAGAGKLGRVARALPPIAAPITITSVVHIHAETLKAEGRIVDLARVLGESVHDARLGLVLLKAEAPKYPQSLRLLLDRMYSEVHYYAAVAAFCRTHDRPRPFRHLWLHAAAKALEGTARGIQTGMYLPERPLQAALSMADFARALERSAGLVAPWHLRLWARLRRLLRLHR